MNPVDLYRGEIFYLTDSPLDKETFYTYIADGALVVSEGYILESGPYSGMWQKYPQAFLHDYSGMIIMPGMIDAHIHFPQLNIVGMYGKKLLDWLNNYTFPSEKDFNDSAYSDYMAEQFVNTLFRNGTTACVAYATVHPHTAESLFRVASRYNMAMFAGKVLMDTNAPDYLLDTNVCKSKDGIEESRRLICKWHKRGRNRYAITPRFAVTSTPHQLAEAGKLHQEFPDTFIQTHLSENRSEIDTVRSLFPKSKDYLDVYERAGLVSERTIFGHCVYLSDDERKRIAEAKAIVAHCPVSNSFLGSGLMNLEQMNRANIQTVFATDVAGGNTFSMLKVMGEAYKVQLLQNYSLSVGETLYRATLGTALSLGLEKEMGSFVPGSFADFIVIAPEAVPELALRGAYLSEKEEWNIENKLFGLMASGDDRCIQATYIAGNKVYTNNSCLNR